MSHFTYQVDETGVPLETYEWDRSWWEHTENKTAKRVFYIGDSISWGIRPEAQRLVKSEVLFDALATSKSLDNPYLLRTLELVLQQTASAEAILVNNGLHGWHLRDETDYPQFFRKLLEELKKYQPNVAVILTTCVADPQRNARVLARNEGAASVAKELGCAVIDLYTPSLQCAHRDGVHFNAEGYCSLAEVLVSHVREILK